MTAPVAVPKFGRIEQVELMHTGTWGLSSGKLECSREDLAAAVAALDCPAVNRPIIKIGHQVPTFDGEPALGWVDGMGLANQGNTLRGDLAGMPLWLKAAAPSAFPNRSVEGARNFRCAIGHLHPFVVTAVSLLGVTPPGIGTLSSLQDHPSLTEYTRALYEVAAASDEPPGGEPVTFTFCREAPVPDDQQPFAAAVALDDLRDAFYDGGPNNLWITEVQIQPLQLIVTDDDSTYRIPVTIGADESISFGTPVPVEVTYVDAQVDPSEIGPVGVAASAGGPVVLPKRRAVFARPVEASVAAAGDEPPNDPTHTPEHTPAKPAVIPQTDPMQDPVAPPSPAQPVTPTPGTAPAAPAVPAAEPATTTEPEGGADVSLSEFRSRLGLDETADEAAVLAALDELKTKATTPAEPPAELVAAAAKADKQSEQFAAAISQIETLSTELAAVKAEKAAERKQAFFAAAVSQGKIAPAERESWESRYDRDAELVSEILGAIKPGTAVPVAAAGYVGDPEPAFSDDDLLRLLPPEMRSDDAKAGV